MKNMRKMVNVLLLCSIFVLTGCADESQYAETVVKGNLDEIYKGEYDEEYLSLVEKTEKESERHYQSRMETEADFLAYYWDMYDESVGQDFESLDKELQEELISFCEEIYSMTDYVVEDAVQYADGSYAVKLSIYPLDVIYLATELYHNNGYEPLNDYWEKYDGVKFDLMPLEERRVAMEEYNEAIMQLLWDQIDEAGYFEAETYSILMKTNEDGYRTITQEDWERINKALVYYP